ncbi:MAG: hypothetical protein ACK4TI_03790 [Nitrososphaerales archaeon]
MVPMTLPPMYSHLHALSMELRWAAGPLAAYLHQISMFGETHMLGFHFDVRCWDCGSIHTRVEIAVIVVEFNPLMPRIYVKVLLCWIILMA